MRKETLIGIRLKTPKNIVDRRSFIYGFFAGKSIDRIVLELPSLGVVSYTPDSFPLISTEPLNIINEDTGRIKKTEIMVKWD